VSEDVDEAIEPHPLPFYEVTYDIGNRMIVEKFLEQCRHQCVIFTHPLGKNAVEDYHAGQWLGETLEIDYDYLAANPEHPRNP